MNTEHAHTSDSPEIRNIFQLHYGAVNQSHRQYVIPNRLHGVYQQQ